VLEGGLHVHGILLLRHRAAVARGTVPRAERAANPSPAGGRNGYDAEVEGDHKPEVHLLVEEAEDDNGWRGSWRSACRSRASYVIVALRFVIRADQACSGNQTHLVCRRRRGSRDATRVAASDGRRQDTIAERVRRKTATPTPESRLA
jgi:hypothetical protein